MRTHTSRWVIATLSIATMIFAAGTLDASTPAEPQQKQKQGKKGGNGGGGGKPGGGGGGDGDSFPRIFNVTLSGDYIVGPGPCNNADGQCDNQATIDEDSQSRLNTFKKNPGDPYWVGANLYVLNDINVQGLELSDLGAGDNSCTAFFGMPSGDPFTVTNFMQASINLALDASEGKYDRKAPSNGPTWTETGARGVKGRITAPNMAWNLRFDSDLRFDSASHPYNVNGGAVDGQLTAIDSGGVEGNDMWTVTISGTVLAQSYSGDGAWGLCNVSLAWNVTRN